MNYTEIINAARAYADRNDTEVDANLGTFINMVESKVNRILKTRQQSNRAFVNTVDDQQYYSLPPDYRGMRNVQLNSINPSSPDNKSCAMHLLNPSQMTNVSGQPFDGFTYYCIMADQIRIHPVQEAGKSIELHYYQKVPNLNLIDASNWLSDDYPDVYISGIVSEIESFAKNYDVATLWYARMSSAISEIESNDSLEVWAGTQLQVRID
jgi:hypothetical protein